MSAGPTGAPEAPRAPGRSARPKDARGPEPGPDFGALLRRHRLGAGLSQQELAERAGFSVRGLSDLERGARRAPYPATVRRLAGALRLSAAERDALVGAARRGAESPPASTATPRPPAWRTPAAFQM